MVEPCSRGRDEIARQVLVKLPVTVGLLVVVKSGSHGNEGDTHLPLVELLVVVEPCSHGSNEEAFHSHNGSSTSPSVIQVVVEPCSQSGQVGSLAMVELYFHVGEGTRSLHKREKESRTDGPSDWGRTVRWKGESGSRVVNSRRCGVERWGEDEVSG